MPQRKFTDSDGTSWYVWDVQPHNSERRTGERRVIHDPPGDDRRDIWDRRGDLRDLPPELLDGWLVFKSQKGRRRLWPVPEGWETMTMEELRQLCRSAAIVSAGEDV